MTGDRMIQLMAPNLTEDVLDSFRRIVDSGNLVEGSFVHELEAVVARYVNVKHAIACTSATTGLELALRAIEVSKGDEVIVPDFTHPATALAVMTVGAEPVLVDVDIGTRTVRAAAIEAAISRRTKAVIPVSMFGHPVEMDSINMLAQKHGLRVIEDAACSLGSEFKGRKVGSLTELSVFSFHPRKVFACGDGGLITTESDDWAARIESMKHFGVGRTETGGLEFGRWGTNSRMTELQGALLLSQIARIDAIIKDRVGKAAVYDELLRDCEGLRIPKVAAGAGSNYQTYAVDLEKDGIRDGVIQEMRKRNVQAQIGTYALHTQPVFKNVRRCGPLQGSARLYRRVLALPLHHKLSRNDQEYVARTLVEVVRNAS